MQVDWTGTAFFASPATDRRKPFNYEGTGRQPNVGAHSPLDFHRLLANGGRAFLSPAALAQCFLSLILCETALSLSPLRQLLPDSELAAGDFPG